MNEISQTKEGFIKSMILFVVLLSVCFAPFFAFSQNTPSIAALNQMSFATGQSVANNMSVSNAESNNIVLNVLSTENNVLLDFKTGFECLSYDIEAKTLESNEFKSISYCHDAKCANANQTVNYIFTLNTQVYTEFRVKANKPDGSVVYSESKQLKMSPKKDIELKNTAVNDVLYLNMNVLGSYTYNISSINGLEIKHDENLSGTSIQLNELQAGFYIISFKGSNGDEMHYKFFKAINL
jgi:hypothetical protein